MATIFGSELLKKLEDEKVHNQNIVSDRHNRIYVKQTTDIDDCYLSISASDSTARLINAKINIIKNGGLDYFETLSFIDGDRTIESKEINGTYGMCWAVSGENRFEYCPIFTPQNRMTKTLMLSTGCKDLKYFYSWYNELYHQSDNVDFQKIDSIVEEAKTAFYAAKGFKYEKVKLPVWVKLGGGNLMTLDVIYFKSSINYATGEIY